MYSPRGRLSLTQGFFDRVRPGRHDCFRGSSGHQLSACHWARMGETNAPLGCQSYRRELPLWRGLQLFPKSFTDLSPEEVEVVRVWTFLGDLSWFFLVLTLLTFFVLLLSHPDIVASFRRRSGLPDKSNRAIEPHSPRGIRLNDSGLIRSALQHFSFSAVGSIPTQKTLFRDKQNIVRCEHLFLCPIGFGEAI